MRSKAFAEIYTKQKLGTAMNIALDFELSDEQMAALNDLTTEKQVRS